MLTFRKSLLLVHQSPVPQHLPHYLPQYKILNHLHKVEREAVPNWIPAMQDSD